MKTLSIQTSNVSTEYNKSLEILNSSVGLKGDIWSQTEQGTNDAKRNENRSNSYWLFRFQLIDDESIKRF